MGQPGVHSRPPDHRSYVATVIMTGRFAARVVGRGAFWEGDCDRPPGPDQDPRSPVDRLGAPALRAGQARQATRVLHVRLRS